MNILKKYTLIGFITVSILGTISHFVYNLTGQNAFIGLFFPVNESTWEHMKLSFFPMLLYAVYMDYRLKDTYHGLTSALSVGIILSTALIPVVFYTYSGILGKNNLILDIATFFISVLLGFYSSYRLTLSCKAQTYAGLLKCLIALTFISFLVFTYYPPTIGIFAQP